MTTVVVLTILVLLLGVENYCMYRDEHPRGTLVRSYTTNLLLMVFGDTAMSVLSIGSLMVIAGEYAHFGLLRGVSGVFQAIIALVSFDAMLYFWHRARHRYPLLWKFHQTHHSDLVMNTTTAFRLHFVELVFTTVVKSIFILVVGVSSDLVLFNETVVVLCAMFHHTNISFRGEKTASFFMVVPYTHRVHHSTKGSEYHRNFGAIFSFWDGLYGTLAIVEPDEVGQKTLGEQNFIDVVILSQKEK
jgi:sterol desaturase/sphingolipid hydroxylase (fatty acid hydroxylase superfamily)